MLSKRMVRFPTSLKCAGAMRAWYATTRWRMETRKAVWGTMIGFKHFPVMGLLAVLLLVLAPGCARLRLPAIDPTGQRVFLPYPNSTSILTPRSAVAPRTPLVGGIGQTQPIGNMPPAYQHPVRPEPCKTRPGCLAQRNQWGPPPGGRLLRRPGREGEIIMTPATIIARSTVKLSRWPGFAVVKAFTSLISPWNGCCPKTVSARSSKSAAGIMRSPTGSSSQRRRRLTETMPTGGRR